MEEETGVICTILKITSSAFDYITYYVYYVFQKPWLRLSLANAPKGKIISHDENSITIRSLDNPGPNHTLLLQHTITNMEEIMEFAVAKYANKKCLGTRKINSEQTEVQKDGKIFKKYDLGDYSWKTYQEVDHAAGDFGKGLVCLGQKKYEKIAIFAETRAEWLIAAQACFKQNFPLVTIYETLGDEATAHAINESTSTLVISSHDLLPKLARIAKSTPNLKTVIYMEHQLFKTHTSILDNLTVFSFNAVIEKGKKMNIGNADLKPTDTAILMYTSGTTGVPKGVILTHENMVTTVKGFSDAIAFYPCDIYMAYLPLAHVYELLSEYLCIFSGIPLGYSSAQTMSDISPKIKKGCRGDSSILKPTVMTAVPLILDRIYKAAITTLDNKGTFTKSLFNFAFHYKKKWIKRGFRTPMIDFLVQNPKKLLGNKVRMIVCGGAALSPQTHEFVMLCVCEKLIQGYGLTESCAAATGVNPYDLSLDRVGAPLTVCDIKLQNWDEGGYLVTDKPYPRGEIIIGGSNVSPGYYELHEKTLEDFFNADGRRWFRTGDIGECHVDGVLKIIDRKKDLVKLITGEYVSLSKIETLLKTSPLVDNVCVYGDSRRDFVVALVTPNRAQLLKFFTKTGHLPIDYKDLCQDVQFTEQVLQKIMKDAQTGNLHKTEIPRRMKLIAEQWTPESNLVTSAFKLKRKAIEIKYKVEIEHMYAQ